MLNSKRGSQNHEETTTEDQSAEDQRVSTPQINIIDPDHKTQTLDFDYNSGSSTETEAKSKSKSKSKSKMSSSHRSSSSSTKGKHSSKSKSSKKDDWSEITDPEERRRVQNRIAQRKFRDKAKDTKEREERDAVNRANAHHAYELTDPRDMGYDDPNGLPWGSLSLVHVMSTGKAKEAEFRRGSQSRSRETETQSSYKHSPSQTVWEDPDQDGYYEETSFFGEGEQAYYSGSYGGNSR